MILPITKIPSQVLRRPVEDITFPLHKDIKRLMQDMIDTVKSAKGVGLAAPQVGKNLNLAVIFLEEAGLPPFFIFNPVLISKGKEMDSMEEGCLSIPGVFGTVRRPKKITLQFANSEGELKKITDDTFLARVLQHEYDHLHQTLIKDKFESITHGKNILSAYDD